MQVVIMGCGRTGRALASRLEEEGDDVTVLDLDPAAAEHLPAGFRGRFVAGSGTSRPLLESAGIAASEAFVAVTSSDAANVVAARTCREVYRVPRVLARLNDPVHATAYRELGVVAVGSVQSTVNRVVRHLHHRTLEPHQSFGNGETLLVRSPVPDYLAGRRASEFNVPGEIQVVELSRSGHSRIPDPATPLAKDDLVTFVVAAPSLGRLESFLDGRWS